MSFLVRYTLNDAKHHDVQIDAMAALVSDLKAAGISGLNYSCFETDNPIEFFGVLEFADDVAKQAFLNSDAFAAYKSRVGPTFANPPQTTDITAIASTRD
ncbi:MAG: L-rhamnose mutarotase [Paracoccaceae bacterium]|jgi:L-rhamnose mutarotase